MARLLGIVLAAGAFLASCSSKGASSPKPDGVARHAAVPVDATATTAPIAIADAAAPADATTADAPLDATRAGTYEDLEGDGSCTKDSDCELSSFQDSCCTRSCNSRAVNRRDLAIREAKADCERKKPAVCPPPAPCPIQTHWMEAAKCKNNKCYALARKL